MALPWVRLESNAAQNPKLLALAGAKRWQSIAMWTFALGYSGGQGTDGFIPAMALPFIHGTKRCADDLVKVGLWNVTDGGWDINGWTEFQPSTEEYEMRRDKAKRAANARWDKEKKVVADAADKA